MPRKRREKSGTDVYHVVSRGNNKQDILEQDSDKNYFMGLMKEKAAKYKVELYAYCIMSNHTHILLKCDIKTLSLFMKELNFDYAIYYNLKNEKCGHVFQGRFYSSCIETEAYLISCIRYIHNNPVRAYMVSDILKYPYSSAKHYFTKEADKGHGCISEHIFDIIKTRFPNSIDFYKFHNNFDNQEFIDIDDEKSEYDFQRIEHLLQRFVVDNNVESFETVEKVPIIRNQFIEMCREETKLSRKKIENFLKMLAEST